VNLRLDGRRAIVTGGSRDIGLAEVGLDGCARNQPAPGPPGAGPGPSPRVTTSGLRASPVEP
jgi:hypothetical protein